MAGALRWMRALTLATLTVQTPDHTGVVTAGMVSITD